MKIPTKLLSIAVAVAAIAACVSTANALPYSLGGASNYAVLSEGGDVFISDGAIYQSGTHIYGNVGIGPRTDFTHHMDAHIHGNLDYDPTVTGTSNFLDQPYRSNISGNVTQMSMSGIVADARNASILYGGLAPTQTFPTWNQNGQTINLTSGLNVIQVTGDVTLKQDFILNGDASSMVVFQFTSTTDAGHDVLSLSGTNMVLNGGILASQILWDLAGDGGDLSITSGANVYGIFLAPDRNILVDGGSVFGQVIGGGSLYGQRSLDIHSTSTITMPEGQVPEGGSALILLGLGLGALQGFRKLFSDARMPVAK